MISSLSLTCRRRQALRAALIAMVALSGCQGSLRTWRRDDPSLHDLVVTPHPRNELSARDQASSYPPERSRTTTSQSGRANPYKQQVAAGQAYETIDDQPTDDDEQVFADDDAEFKALLSEVGPADRVELIKIYKAMQAQIRAGGHEPRVNARHALADIGTTNDDDDDDRYRTNSHSTTSRSKAAAKSQRQVSPESGEVRYAFSDNEQYHENQVQRASATRTISAEENETLATDGGDLGNRPTRSRDEVVHLQLNDQTSAEADEEEFVEQPPRINSTPAPNKKTLAKSGTKPQELKPPSKLRSNRPIVQEPVADTGLVEPLQFQQPARGPREDEYAISSRKQTHAPQSNNASSEEIDSHYTDSSYVAQASAESSINAESSVQPATLRPSARTTSAAAPGTTPRRSSDADAQSEQPQLEDWRQLAQKTLRSLEQESVDSSDNAQLHHHMTKRILFVLLGQLEQALEPIPNLKPHEQEYFRHNLTALHNSIDPQGNPVRARRWPLVLEDQRIAMSHLGAASNLEVKNAAFCSHVDGFGSVTKFPTYKFTPNQQVLLYCEVDNFVSTKIKDGYESKLRGNYEIVDANQTRVADFLLQEASDFCTSPRRDYFFAYHIYMPKTIAPGRYQLRLTIEDMKGNKFGQTSLDMQIVAE